jgi:hypothetical protein
LPLEQDSRGDVRRVAGCPNGDHRVRADDPAATYLLNCPKFIRFNTARRIFSLSAAVCS